MLLLDQKDVIEKLINEEYSKFYDDINIFVILSKKNKVKVIYKDLNKKWKKFIKKQCKKLEKIVEMK